MVPGATWVLSALKVKEERREGRDGARALHSLLSALKVDNGDVVMEEHFAAL